MDVQLYKCRNCDEITLVDEADTITLYECGECGTVFSQENSYTGYNHQCPDCHKFSSKLTDEGCPECQEGELEETDGSQCDECDEIFEDEKEYRAHLEKEHPEEGTDVDETSAEPISD